MGTGRNSDTIVNEDSDDDNSSNIVNMGGHKMKKDKVITLGQLSQYQEDSPQLRRSTRKCLTPTLYLELFLLLLLSLTSRKQSQSPPNKKKNEEKKKKNTKEDKLRETKAKKGRVIKKKNHHNFHLLTPCSPLSVPNFDVNQI